MVAYKKYTEDDTQTVKIKTANELKLLLILITHGQL